MNPVRNDSIPDPNLTHKKSAPWHGFADKKWKKNQKFLNTHTDPYKKAAALLGTLRNPQDKKMCECIYDFDKLISILNDKYDHQEKLIPTLKNKLDKLPKALTDEMMLENHRTSLNVYEQLKELGAKSCFDGTGIYNLTQKFTMQAKKDFEIQAKKDTKIQANKDFEIQAKKVDH